MKIEGVPEGWELLRIGPATGGDWYIGISGRPTCCEYKDGSYSVESFAIIRKVERPKTYRPFASAEEFKPHRDRWVINASDSDIAYRTKAYSDERVWVDTVYTWEEAFRYFNFADDGTPFGVEYESSGPPITRPAQTY